MGLATEYLVPASNSNAMLFIGATLQDNKVIPSVSN